MNTFILLAAFALLLIDWRQTLTIFRRGRRELNPVIRWAYARWGRRGVDGYFAAWVAVTVLLAMALRETAALLSWTFGGIPLVWEALLNAAIAAIAVIELIVVVRNHRRGIRA
jgi:hypothetical protein